MKFKLYGLLTFVALLVTMQTSANERATDLLGDAVIGQWNASLLAGYAAIENPLSKRDNIKTHILPTWSYYGDNFYIDNTTLGYSLIETSELLFDISTYLNEDGALFNLDHANLSFLDISHYVPRKNMRPNTPEPVFETIERKFSYMAGIAIQWPNDYIQARLVFGKDISAGHGGKEITLSLFNQYQVGHLKFNWQIGAVHKNQALVNYYYDLRPQEINGISDSGLDLSDIINTYAQIALSYQITKNLDLVLSVKQTWLDDSLLISPIVEKDSYLKGVTGINFKF